MRLRSVPEIRFLADDSVEAGEQVEAALELARLRAAGLAEPPPVVPSVRSFDGANERIELEDEAWRPRSSFPDVGAAFEDMFLGPMDEHDSEGEEEEEEGGDDESGDDDDDEEDADAADGFLDLGPASDRPTSSSAAAPSSRARDPVAASPSQQQDSFFGFEPPPLEGFWPGGDVPGVFSSSSPLGGTRARATEGDSDGFDATEDLGDGFLGPDGIVRLAPGSGSGGGGGGGGKKPPGGGGKPRQRPQRRR